MNEDEVITWLREHGVSASDANAMMMDARRGLSGYSNTCNGVFISWDGQMYNAYT